jgi:outer membrane protein assembly factor BamD
MRGRRHLILLILALGFLLPQECPAPLVYRPGEGWTYETPGSEGKWTRARAQDQLEVAQAAFDDRNYSVAIKAATRVTKVWPLSDHAAPAQYLLARSYEAKGNDERAFKEYQTLVEKHPKFDRYQEVVERQFAIANRFLDGKRFKLWGTVRLFPSMERTVGMYEKIVQNGPYSPVAPRAQLNIGAAREKQKAFLFFNQIDSFRMAVDAYERAADRYHDNREIASEATFKAGLAYERQALKADYDQSIAIKADATFLDFITLYPNDPRVIEAQRIRSELRTEQARGTFSIAQYYEKRKKWPAAMIYYNETYLRDPTGPYAEGARVKLDSLRLRTGLASVTPTNTVQ